MVFCESCHTAFCFSCALLRDAHEQKREHNRKQKLAQRMAAHFVRDEMPEIWEDIRRAVGIDVDWANRCKPRRKRGVKTRKR